MNTDLGSRETQVNMELSKLEKEMAEFEGMLVDLLMRLIPVLSPEGNLKEPNGPSVQARPSLAPIAERLNGTRNLLREFINRVTETLKRLEI